MKTVWEWKEEVKENGVSLNQISMILNDWEEQNNKLIRGFQVIFWYGKTDIIGKE